MNVAWRTVRQITKTGYVEGLRVADHAGLARLVLRRCLTMSQLLLFHLAGGDAFWTSCILAARAVLMVMRGRKRWALSLAWLLVLVSALAFAGSGTPQPVWLTASITIVLLSWLTLQSFAKRPPRRLCLLLGAVALCLLLLAAALEYTWHRTPRIPLADQRRLYVVADSISAGLGTPGVIQWSALVAGEHQIEVVDYSVAGATAASALQHLQGKPIGPGVVLLEIGGNDMIGGRHPEEFAQALDALLRRVSSVSRCVVMLELPVLPGQTAYARIQREMATRYGVPMLPKRQFASILTRPGNTLDGLHLSAKGHRKMADWIWESLAPAFGRRN